MPTPERTSVAEIVSAGREVLEDAGPTGLTMRAVAQRVGVRAPSLYKRVRDREALLGLIAAATVDDVIDRVLATDGTLAGLARAYRGFGQERPEGFRLMLAVGGDVESAADVTAPLLRLAAAMVGESESLEAARLITAWIVGFVTMERAGAFRLGGDVEHAFEFGIARLTAALSGSAGPAGGELQ